MSGRSGFSSSVSLIASLNLGDDLQPLPSDLERVLFFHAREERGNGPVRFYHVQHRLHFAGLAWLPKEDQGTVVVLRRCLRQAEPDDYVAQPDSIAVGDGGWTGDAVPVQGGAVAAPEIGKVVGFALSV